MLSSPNLAVRNRRTGVLALVIVGSVAPAAFAQFIEDDVQVLGTIDAREAQSFFGYEVRTIDDVSGDGVQDFLVGAPVADGSGANTGRVDCYSGATFELLWDRSSDRDGSIFGYEIEPIVDVTGDGVPDVAVGGPFGEAMVWILSGSDGLPFLRLEEPGVEEFGSAISSGDIDGDGQLELLVGAPDYDDVEVDQGRVYIYSMQDFALEAIIERPGDSFFFHGKMLTVFGDVTGDGAEEFVVFAGDGPTVFAAEAFVYTWTGSEFEVLYSVGDLALTHSLLGNAVSGGRDLDSDGLPDWVVHPSTSSLLTGVSGVDGAILFEEILQDDDMGQTVHLVPDLDGDGVPDIMTGLFASSDGAPVAGKFLIVSGRTGQVIHTLTHTIEDARIGMGHDLIEDITGDGIPDLVIGAEGHFIGAPRGAIWIIAGPDLSPGCAADLDGDGDADADDFFAYLDAFASGVSGVCDIDEDGDCDGEDFFAYLDLFIQPC